MNNSVFQLCINDQQAATLEQARVPEDFSSVILAAANILASHGEQLKKGDWIITGAAARAVPVKAGDKITVDMGPLGMAQLNIYQRTVPV